MPYLRCVCRVPPWPAGGVSAHSSPAPTRVGCIRCTADSAQVDPTPAAERSRRPGGWGRRSFGAGVSRARCGAGARRGTESIMPAARTNIERYLYFSRLIPKTISISRHIVLAAAADPRRGKFAAPRAARRCGIVGTVPASTTTRVRVPGWHGLGAIYEEILPECPIEPCSERVALEPIVDGNVELAFLCV